MTKLALVAAMVLLAVQTGPIPERCFGGGCKTEGAVCDRPSMVQLRARRTCCDDLKCGSVDKFDVGRCEPREDAP